MNSNYPIKGTFIDEISYDIPTQNYSKDDWIRELDYMKSVGINTVIFIRGCFYDKCIYPSKYFKTLRDESDDLLGLILYESEKREMNVFIGLYMKDLCWGDGDYENEIIKNRIFIDEVYEKYGKYKSFYGWYIPHEVGNDSFNIKIIFRELSKMCKEKTPDKKILISPFFYSSVLVKEGALSPVQMREEWEKIFEESGSNIDYCAIQDGSAPLDLMEEYFKEMNIACNKYNIELWANVELMGRNMVGFNPIEFVLLKYKINILKPIVKNMITFEFSHFLSPQSVFPAARNLFKQYKEYYK